MEDEKYRFTGIPFTMIEDITNEQLLHLALDHINRDGIYQEIADKIVINYIMLELQASGESFTEEDISDRYSQLRLDYTLTRLAEEEMVEVNFEGSEALYKITEKGKDMLNDN